MNSKRDAAMTVVKRQDKTTFIVTTSVYCLALCASPFWVPGAASATAA